MFHALLFLASIVSTKTTPEAKTTVHYTITVNSADLSGYNVEMNIANAPATFHLAMVAHPEYDDRFWRYLHQLTIDGKDIADRQDSALWLIKTTAGNHIIRYRIDLPPATSIRPSWRPFLTPTGGLIGGPQSFLYIGGQTHITSTVTYVVPPDWKIATSLTKIAEPSTFICSGIQELTDAPALAGHIQQYDFKVRRTLHHLVYFPLPGNPPLDTSLYIQQLSGFAAKAAALFGGFPFKEYYFLLQDGAYGALEHYNSVTIGATIKDLKEDTSLLMEIAHEYFHSWNLLRLKPAEYKDVVFKDPPLAKELWWSEGLTMFYADLLLRRAGLPVKEASRTKHLESILNQYYASPGNQKISPLEVSRTAFGRPGMLGDYDASTYIQGELLGTLLDINIRNATNGSASIDNVMKTAMLKYTGGRGFTSTNIEKIVEDKCHCTIHPFFSDHILNSKPLDVNAYLKMIGLQSILSYQPAVNEKDQPLADHRIFAWQKEPGTILLLLTDPSGSWGAAGLHSNDEIISINDIFVNSLQQFNSIIRKTKIGDVVNVEVRRPSGTFNASVEIKGYQLPVVKVEKLPNATAQEEKLFNAWEFGN